MRMQLSENKMDANAEWMQLDGNQMDANAEWMLLYGSRCGFECGLKVPRIRTPDHDCVFIDFHRFSMIFIYIR